MTFLRFHLIYVNWHDMWPVLLAFRLIRQRQPLSTSIRSDPLWVDTLTIRNWTISRQSSHTGEEQSWAAAVSSSQVTRLDLAFRGEVVITEWLLLSLDYLESRASFCQSLLAYPPLSASLCLSWLALLVLMLSAIDISAIFIINHCLYVEKVDGLWFFVWLIFWMFFVF